MEETLISEPEVQSHETSTQLLSAPKRDVDAGTNMMLKAGVSCAGGCNLQGGVVQVLDQAGAVVAEAELHSEDGLTNATDAFAVKAPDEPGVYTWTVLFPAHEGEGVRYEESSTPLTFTVRLHQITLNVWDVPLPATSGQKFAVKVGAKCSAGCSLAGLRFEIEDGKGEKVGAGQLAELWPKSTATYWASQELAAPAEEGLFKWVVNCPAPELESPHQVAPQRFSFRTVRAPEHTATIEVVDRRTKKPVQDAAVRVAMRRGKTDARGVAEIGVVKGTHGLYVVGEEYVPYETTVEVKGDETFRVELVFCPDIVG